MYSVPLTMKASENDIGTNANILNVPKIPDNDGIPINKLIINK